MALAITNANSNISDTTLTYTLGWTGHTGDNLVLTIIVNGTVIGTRNVSSSSASGSSTVTYTASNLYSAANGNSLSGAVVFRIVSRTGTTDGDVAQRTGGNITINARLTNHSLVAPQIRLI